MQVPPKALHSAISWVVPQLAVPFEHSPLVNWPMQWFDLEKTLSPTRLPFPARLAQRYYTAIRRAGGWVGEWTQKLLFFRQLGSLNRTTGPIAHRDAVCIDQISRGRDLETISLRDSSWCGIPTSLPVHVLPMCRSGSSAPFRCF